MEQNRLKKYGNRMPVFKNAGFNVFIFLSLVFLTTKENIIHFYDTHVLIILSTLPFLLILYSLYLMNKNDYSFINNLKKGLFERGYLFANITASILLIYSLTLKFGKDLNPIELFYPQQFEVKSRGSYKGCWYSFLKNGERYSFIKDCPCNDFEVSNAKGTMVVRIQRTFLNKIIVIDASYVGHPC